PHRVEDAALRHAAKDASHALVEEVEVEVGLAVRVNPKAIQTTRHYGDGQPHQRNECQPKGEVHHGGHGAVRHLAAGGDLAKGGSGQGGVAHQLAPSNCARRETTQRASMFTSKVM